MTELEVLQAVIEGEIDYSHWRTDYNGRDGLRQVLKWIRKVRQREPLSVEGKGDLVAAPAVTLLSVDDASLNLINNCCARMGASQSEFVRRAVELLAYARYTREELGLS